MMLLVDHGVVRVRLEDYLLRVFPRLSKMYIRDVIRAGECEVNGRVENIGYRLRTNDVIEIALDPDRETAMSPDPIPLDFVFEDEDIIVVNKSAGMLTHPSHRENRGTLLNALVHHLNWRTGNEAKQNGDECREMLRPGLPHRLDKATSGLIVAAKNARAHRIVSGQFMQKRVEKRYLALVEGIVEQDDGVISAPIGRFPELKLWGVKDDGKPAETRFWVRERRDGKTLLELEPITGRTNQLRIHCEHLGHPIVGDVARGGGEYVRLCLHAFRLGLRHPTTGENLSFVREIEF
ncbi:MAG: RluA family pseudouridine synthase [Acidobacteria bacterium]|nr:RluA family pseudouridine synthase [Acidobacteriota bacterium]MCW5949354.1 RluA family pseudouridine synthase [Pyrinomonadaceae bacterium]